jgi:hypothetical protein
LFPSTHIGADEALSILVSLGQGTTGEREAVKSMAQIEILRTQGRTYEESIMGIVSLKRKDMQRLPAVTQKYSTVDAAKLPSFPVLYAQGITHALHQVDSLENPPEWPNILAQSPPPVLEAGRHLNTPMKPTNGPCFICEREVHASFNFPMLDAIHGDNLKKRLL